MSTLAHRTPGGSQTRSKQWAVFGGDPYPQTVDRAIGSKVHVYTPDPRVYIDWIAALASVGLGYAHPVVDEAVRQQMEQGTAFPLPTRLEFEVADLLCDTLKWPQQVRFVKTGSEATAAAMQIARAQTKRKKILSIGYHGWHEAHLPSEHLIDVPWGRLEVLGREIGCDVAAVLVEPMRDHLETPEGSTVSDYLKCVQDWCYDYGALFILDEVVTGFRWAKGGASEAFDLTPDLACYGKAMANGYPLAAIVGPRRLMKHATEVSSTFGGEAIGLAAAKATIEIYRKEPVISRLWQIGKRLLAGCPILTGWPVHPHFVNSAGWTTSDACIGYVQRAAAQGILIHPAGMNPMYAHSDADVEQTIAVINAVTVDSAA